jgi:hypothetical protein
LVIATFYFNAVVKLPAGKPDNFQPQVITHPGYTSTALQVKILGGNSVEKPAKTGSRLVWGLHKPDKSGFCPFETERSLPSFYLFADDIAESV